MALDVPVYHLDGVVQNRSERENFDGPLDLILLLLSKNKMEIADIQIALILDQYLAWMNQRQTLDLEVASEFVAMAAHLVYIKTRMLLSLQDEEAASEVEALIASLEARQRSASYSKIQAVLPTLQHRYTVGKDYLPKPPEPLPPANDYPYEHPPTDLPQALGKLLLKRSAEALPPLSAQFEGIVAREPYPVEEKASGSWRGLTRSGTTAFSDLFRDSRSRSEVVATFLAVLELCRGRVSGWPRGHLGGGGEGDWMTMEFQDIKSTIEGMCGLCQVLAQDEAAIEGAIHALADEYALLRIVQLGDRYQMCSAPEYADPIRQALDLAVPQLSPAALESLAINFQPATKGVVGADTGGGFRLHGESIGGTGPHPGSGTAERAGTTGAVPNDGPVPALLWPQKPGRPAAPAGAGGRTGAGPGAGGRSQTTRTGRGGVTWAS